MKKASELNVEGKCHVEFIAKCLKELGVDSCFGVVGIPVTSLAVAMQKEGIKFYSFRNEQSASYAAGVYGYLTQKPGFCLVVAGPGMVNAISGLSNATANCWPMVLISAGVASSQQGTGSFQEVPHQIDAARCFTKYAQRVESIDDICKTFKCAIKNSLSGRPGSVYIELDRDVLEQKISKEHLEILQKTGFKENGEKGKKGDKGENPYDVKNAVKLMLESHKPLIILGKGAAYSRAEKELSELIDLTNIPFLPSPMAKGLLPDDHRLCASPSRSLALKEADLLLIVGARMNWMYDFGKFVNKEKNVQVIQIDILEEEINNNLISTIGLCGDARLIINQLNDEIKKRGKKWSSDYGEWIKVLQKKKEENIKTLLQKRKEVTHPLRYHHVLSTINDCLPDDVIIVNEGAHTMDIGRIILQNKQPRSRLDCGTLGTMGVGIAYAICAATVFPNRKVVTIQGDSAFGFSAGEIEVACRYNLPITFIVLNNNGIYSGLEEHETRDPTKMPPTALSCKSNYEKIMEAFGGVPYCVTKSDELTGTLKKAIENDKPSLVNIFIDPVGPFPSLIEIEEAAQV